MALSEFIVKSDTPLTVGLQGEWGSGKTSLMFLIRELLQDKKVATAWVNTWEYSMFRGAHETTPAVLQGLLVKLKEACGDKWTLDDKAKEKWKSVVRFAGALGNQILANNAGLDAKAAIDEAATGGSDATMTDIADLKAGIADVIQKLIADTRNDFQRVVFFVDDLDRISPTDAVEVLEALKNVFDIPNCIFVLAIDYEVVVKGLEGKFGPKTEENEREFRSFFDKIIQLPFSMPTGTYKIENFLVHKLNDLGVVLPADRQSAFGKVVKYTVGYNPRSLKRYINSFSLLNSIRKMDEAESDDATETDELMLFALLGIQISYPKIFRMLTVSPDYLTWDAAFGAKQGLEWDSVLENLKKFGDSELTNEDWERVVWGSCQRDTYMKARVTGILELLNLLRSTFEDSLSVQLEQAMEFAAITSVDDDASTKQAIQQSGSRIRFTGIDLKVEQLKEQGVREDGIEIWRHLWDRLDKLAAPNGHFSINYAKTASTLYDLRKGKSDKQQIYVVNPVKTSLGYHIWIKKGTGKTAQIHDRLTREGIEGLTDSVSLVKDDLYFNMKLASTIGKERFNRVIDIVLDELGYA